VTKLNPDEIKEENPQCNKRTTASDEGQGTSNSNTHVSFSKTKMCTIHLILEIDYTQVVKHTHYVIAQRR